jgi:hypothetical protein
VTAPNPFAQVERLLLDPAADGAFLTLVRDASPFAEAGFLAGDVVVALDEQPVADAASFLQRVQEGDAGPAKARVVRSGATLEIDLPRERRGVAACTVRRGQPAWEDREDTPYEPDFRGLADGTEVWLRMMFGEEPGGFERYLVRHRDGRLDVDWGMWIGGGVEPAEFWQYRSRGRSLHEMDRTLSACALECSDGLPGEEVSRGRVQRGADGFWRGVHAGPQGEREVAFPDGGARGLSPFVAGLLPTTMPLEEDACLTFLGLTEGTGLPTGRHRMECLGPRTVDVAGRAVEAFAFAWRHYGDHGPGGDEVLFVDRERRLVRVEWGPGYGGCWSVAVPKERVLDGAPDFIGLA